MGGATVCMHQEMQSICGHGHNPYSGLANYGWYGDHGLAVESGQTNNWDDEYFMWNVQGCADNNDSTAYHQGRKTGPFVCCVETYPNWRRRRQTTIRWRRLIVMHDAMINED